MIKAGATGDSHIYTVVFTKVGSEDNRPHSSKVVVTDGYSTFSDIPKILEILHGPVFIRHVKFLRTEPKGK